ncbi:unknown [Bacteroides sp. CAG:462]|nr:unknown [Bacteroides sp. CAG:462]
MNFRYLISINLDTQQGILVILQGHIINLATLFAKEMSMKAHITIETRIMFVNCQHSHGTMFYKKLQRVVDRCA